MEPGVNRSHQLTPTLVGGVRLDRCRVPGLGLDAGVKNRFLLVPALEVGGYQFVNQRSDGFDLDRGYFCLG